jgi:hypothetical protein
LTELPFDFIQEEKKVNEKASKTLEKAFSNENEGFTLRES